MNALEKFTPSDDPSEARLSAEYNESKQESTSELLQHLRASLEEAEVALEQGDNLLAAQWAESIKSSLQADVENQLLSGSDVAVITNAYRQLADKIYFDDDAERSELAIVEGAKRDFFEKAVQAKLDEVDRSVVFASGENDNATKEAFQQLESLEADYVAKNLSQETRERLEGTLSGLRNSLGL